MSQNPKDNEISNEIKSLLEQRDNMNQEITQAENTRRRMKENIKDIEKQLFRKCKHKWEYDQGCAFDDHTKYFCSICKVWNNHYWYE